MANYLYELSIRDNYAYFGVPTPLEYNLSTIHRVFRNDGFLLGYSDFYAQPLWATYKISPIEERKNLPRPNRFRSDWRTFFWVDHDDYTGSGYDRGHIVPNYAISQLYGKDAQEASFLMSNISPQKPNLNQKVWQRLEAAGIDHFTNIFGDLWVVTGPIFRSDAKRMENMKVAIPEAFFMIFITLDDKPKTLGFIVPQSVKGNEKLEKFVVSIDEIEARTGFDFFSKMPQPLQENIESTIDVTEWKIPTNTKNRY